MVDQPSNQGDDQQDRAADAKARIFSANTDLNIFFLKTILILNSGALVSILLAISNSDNLAISNALIGASIYFGIGLSAGLLGILFYSVEINLDKELRRYISKQNRLGVLIYGISILLSVSIFVYGIWNTIVNLKGALELP